MSRSTSEKPGNGTRLSRRRFVAAALAAVPTVGLLAKPKVALSPETGSGTPASRIRSYRMLGRTGFKVSDIGFGAGNLANANVLSVALDRGVNYIDTGEHYERGGSERTIGEVLRKRDRKSLFITTKLNLSFDPRTSKEGIIERFGKCLERLQTDYADCLMIHMCTLAQVGHEPYHQAIRELKAAGKVRFSGLSNHGSDLSLYGRLTDPMDQVILAAAEDGRFDVVLFVYNYLKTDMGEWIMASCRAKDMGLTLMKMNPAFYIEEDQNILAGYIEKYKSQGKELPEALVAAIRLAEKRAGKTREFLKKRGLTGPEQARTAAIKFCLDNPNVHVVCPTMITFDDVEAYVALSGQPLATTEKAMLSEYAELAADAYCRHACGQCESQCPHGVPVNTIMRYRYYYQAGREKAAMAHYAALPSSRADRCLNCTGNCQRACPYGVPIQGKLIMAHDTLTLA